VIVAPIARRIKIASPDAEAITASGSLLLPVSPGGDRKTLSDHGGAKINPSHQAGGEQAIVLIDIFGAAVSGTGRQQLRHAITRCPAAGPGRTGGIGTALRQFRCIQAQQPDAIRPQSEAIAIARASRAGNGRRGPVQRRCHERRDSQHPYGQQRPAGATKQRFALVESRPDFTTR
jgi:hypothetical protein